MPSSVQQKVYSVLSSIGCTRVCISKDENTNRFQLSYANNWKLVVYLICHLNFLVKVSFVVLLSYGAFTPITEFFDWIAVLLWFLIIFMILTSERLFFRKYPFFEILSAGWAYEEDLYRSLIDKGDDFKKKLHGLAYSRIFLQSWIAVLGSAAMLFQYLAAPKYCVFTFSATDIPEDNLLFYVLFGAHELLFIFHGWQFYGGIIYVSSCFGAEMTLCIKTLREVMQSSIIDSRKNTNRFLKRHVLLEVNSPASGRSPARFNASVDNPISLEDNEDHMKHRVRSSFANSLENVMMEYRKLTIWSDRINDYASYNFLVIHGLAYCQMVSDVFVMIQLLRMPETDIVSVVFFAEDAGVCMYMLFKVFKSMSFVRAASDDYLLVLRQQLTTLRLPPGNRLYLRKLYRSIRKVQMKIGPTTIGPGMVGNAMMTLLNYYICAAMW